MGDIVNELFGLVFAVTLLWIVWGLVLYFFELNSEEAKRENKAIIMNGVTTLLILMLFYALVAWIRGVLGV